MQAAIMDTDSTRRELQQLRTTYLDTNQKMEELSKVCFKIEGGCKEIMDSRGRSRCTGLGICF